ncbi:MAG: type II secretion system F family protein [Bdellovibrionota bacterium]
MEFLYISAAIVSVLIVILLIAIKISSKKNSKLGNFRNSQGDTKDKVKKVSDREKKAKDKEDLETLFARAGMFSQDERAKFNIFRKITPIVCLAIGIILGLKFGGIVALLCIIAAIYLGLKIPDIRLNKKIKDRNEDILYYLPLVIEQLVIGVSSALDVGPCISYVVDMAEKRGTHNPVTLLLKQVQTYVRFGASLDNALSDIGRESGHNELKNSFLQLAQVTKHGGEITKQLQDLGTTVAKQREVIIDGRIKTLELKATGPVFLVFAGNMTILLGFIILGLLKSMKEL